MSIKRWVHVVGTPLEFSKYKVNPFDLVPLLQKKKSSTWAMDGTQTNRNRLDKHNFFDKLHTIIFLP